MRRMRGATLVTEQYGGGSGVLPGVQLGVAGLAGVGPGRGVPTARLLVKTGGYGPPTPGVCPKNRAV